MGSGKTTISSLLHSKLPRTALLGMDKIKWLLSDFQRTNDYDLVSKVMVGMCKTFLEQGCNLLIEQAFWKKEYVQPYIDLANEFKTNLYFYQLEAPVGVLKKRAQGRPNTPKKPPVTNVRIDENIKKWQENRYEFGRNIDTEKLSPEEVVKLILQDII